MNAQMIKELVGSTFFSATFLKKDGTIRKMNARLGVKKHLKGGEKSYTAEDFNYITVFDMVKKQYRTINVSTLLELKVNGKVITIK
jgi:hypothetical protein